MERRYCRLTKLPLYLPFITAEQTHEGLIFLKIWKKVGDMEKDGYICRLNY